MTMETLEQRTFDEWLVVKEMSVLRLARRLKKSPQAVYGWKNGETKPVNSRAVHRALGLQEGQIIWGAKGSEAE